MTRPLWQMEVRVLHSTEGGSIGASVERGDRSLSDDPSLFAPSRATGRMRGSHPFAQESSVLEFLPSPNVQPQFLQRLLRRFRRSVPGFLASPPFTNSRLGQAPLTRGPQQGGNGSRECGILVPTASLVVVASIPYLVDE